jgi:hypothetical protein
MRRIAFAGVLGFFSIVALVLATTEAEAGHRRHGCHGRNDCCQSDCGGRRHHAKRCRHARRNRCCGAYVADPCGCHGAVNDQYGPDQYGPTPADQFDDDVETPPAPPSASTIPDPGA